MREYYGRPDLTHAAVEDGWYRTGDLGRMDESGNLFLLGRTRGVIIKHCRKITPADVEEVLGRHPAVLECAAMGRPDALCGERVACFVTFRPELRAESEELYRHCSALLPDDHCPDEMHVLERLPRNARGKVDVAALSDAAGSPEEPGCRLHRGLAGGRVAEEAER
jgi:acyl-CoA synthetase (AMP-forming)/AMP-acid ligase II